MSRKTVVLLGLVAVLFLGVLGVTAYVLLFPSPAIGPLRPEAAVLPAETRLILGVNVAAARRSDAWKGLLEAEPPEAGDARAARGSSATTWGRDLAGLERWTGVRLERDVDEIVVGAGGNDGLPSWTIALVFGRFDAERIRATLAAQGLVRAQRSVAGTPLHVLAWRADGDWGLAFPAPDLALLGPTTLVESALAARERARQPLLGNEPLRSLLLRLAQPRPLWLAADETAVRWISHGPIHPPASALPLSLTVAAGVGGDVEVAGEMADEAGAARLAQTIQGLVAFGRARAARGRSTPVDADLMQVIDHLSVQADGRLTRLTLPAGAAPTLVASATSALSSWLATHRPPAFPADAGARGGRP